MKQAFWILLGIAIHLLMACEWISAQQPQGSPYGNWPKGITTDESFFPIGVWLQNPRNATRYKQAGINLYVGLWKGPNEQQLSMLKDAGMPVICSQNELGLSSPNADIIVGWMHGDEPDNAQPKPGGGYGPPIEPGVIEADYRRLREKDPSRPIFLNLGQGVAYDNYIGRGVRRNHPEDYPLYIRGCDIVSFDIYPAVHDKPEVAGKLEFVPNGVERLLRWSDNKKIIWNCIECSRISNKDVKPTIEQIRSEVWMSLIQGSRGIIYFVHQFEPIFKEASLFEDSALLEGITKLNAEIAKLAPVLNTPNSVDQSSDYRITVESDREATISSMSKKLGDSIYLFIANHRSSTATYRIRIPENSVIRQTIDLDLDREISEESLQTNIPIPGYGIRRLRFNFGAR
jgi:hypothetical protein